MESTRILHHVSTLRNLICGHEEITVSVDDRGFRFARAHWMHLWHLEALGNKSQFRFHIGGSTLKNVQEKKTQIVRIVSGLVLIGAALVFLTGCWPFNTAPVASFTVSALTGLAPLTISFSALSSYDSDGIISTYEWDYGDGTSSRGDEVSHTYATEGTYTATLQVTDNGGKIASTQKTITVLPPEDTDSGADGGDGGIIDEEDGGGTCGG